MTVVFFSEVSPPTKPPAGCHIRLAGRSGDGTNSYARPRIARFLSILLAISLIGVLACSGNGPSEPGADSSGSPTPLVVDSTAPKITRVGPVSAQLTSPEPIPTATPFQYTPLQLLPSVASDGKTLWITNFSANTVEMLTSREFVGSFQAGNGPSSLLLQDGNVWVANSRDGTVSKFVPNEQPKGPFQVGPDPRAMAFDGEHVWVANAGNGTISKLTLDGTEAASADAGGRATDLLSDGESIWVADGGNNRLVQVALDGSRKQVVDVGRLPNALAFDGEHVWVANAGEDTVSKVARDGSLVDTYSVGDTPVDIVFSDFHGNGHLWVANMADDTVTKLTLDGQPLAVVRVSDAPASIVEFGDALVVVSSTSGMLDRVPLDSGGAGM